MESSIIKVLVDQDFIRDLATKEVERLVGDKGPGAWWDLKRLESETCRKRDWLKENILLNPKFKSEMAKITNNCEGGNWMFRGREMQEFLDEHFHVLNGGKRK